MIIIDTNTDCHCSKTNPSCSKTDNLTILLHSHSPLVFHVLRFPFKLKLLSDHWIPYAHICMVTSDKRVNLNALHF